MEKTETIRELLKTMDQISTQMRDIIYFKYFDKLGNDKKYILSMMNDAFQTTSVFCYATQHVYLTQAGLIFRQASLTGFLPKNLLGSFFLSYVKLN